MSLRRDLIVLHDRLLHIGHRFDGHNARAADTIDEQVTYGGHDKGLGLRGQAPSRGFIDACVSVLPKIRNLAVLMSMPAQEGMDQAFQRQDMGYEPLIQRRGHRATR